MLWHHFLGGPLMARIALCFAVLTLVCACASMKEDTEAVRKDMDIKKGGTGLTSDVAEPARKDIVIQFDKSGVQPTTNRVLSGGNVAFANLSDEYANVLFPMSDVSKFGCKDLRPNFMKTARGIESVPLQGSSPNITLPCVPAKGTYPFKVGFFGRQSGQGDPNLTIDGVLVVE